MIMFILTLPKFIIIKPSDISTQHTYLAFTPYSRPLYVDNSVSSKVLFRIIRINIPSNVKNYLYHMLQGRIDNLLLLLIITSNCLCSDVTSRFEDIWLKRSRPLLSTRCKCTIRTAMSI